MKRVILYLLVYIRYVCTYSQEKLIEFTLKIVQIPEKFNNHNIT